MGLFDNFFSDTKKTTSTSTSTTTPNVPDWFKQMLQGNLEQANTLASASPQDRVAGFSNDQISAQDYIRNLLGQGDSNYQKATSSLSDMLQNGGVGPNDYKQYMNPYQQDVTDTSIRKAVQNADIQRNNLRSNAAMSGAFGGDRAAIQEGLLNNDINTQVGDIQYQGASDAFKLAQQLAQQNSQNKLNAATGLANVTGQSVNNSLLTANALNQSGTQQQQLEQAYKDVPYNNVGFLSNLINSTPTNIYGVTTNSSGTQETPTAGWGSQLLGAGLGAAALFSGNPMLMAGGASSLLGGGGSGSGGFESMLNLPSTQLKTNFADGGLVQNFADGGLIDRLNASADSRLDDYNKNGSFLGNILTGKYKIKTPTNLLESIYRTPAGVLGEALSLPYKGFEKLGQAEHSAVDYLTEPYAERDKRKALEAATARALQQKQEAAPTTSTTGAPGEQSFYDNLKGGLLPPPVQASSPSEPSSAMTDAIAVNQDVVTPNANSKELDPYEIYKNRIANIKPKEKTWLDNVNVPLLAAAGAIGSSDKPFFGAIGEGMSTGAKALQDQRSSESSLAGKEEQRAIDELNALIASQTKAKDLQIKQQKADQSKSYMETLAKGMNAKLANYNSKQAQDIRTTAANNATKALAANPQYMVAEPAQQQVMFQAEVAKQIDALTASDPSLAGMGGTPVQSTNKQVDFSDLLKRKQ